jgi:hypothetical protein
VVANVGRWEPGTRINSLQSAVSARRLAAIALLEQQPDKRAIEIAMTALQDRNILVQKRAWRFLMAQTDQTFASDETRKWAEWWAAQQATFTPKSAEQVREQARDRRHKHFLAAVVLADASIT